MTKNIYFLILLLLSIGAKAQSDSSCGTNETEQVIRAKDSLRYDGRMFNFRQVVRYYRSQHPSGSYLPNPSVPPTCSTCLVTGPNCPKTKFVIPVVVHVVYNTRNSSVTNISDAQIAHQIEELNRHYSNYYLTGSPAVNTGIQFVLANKNINGTTITGITRHNSLSLSIHKKISKSDSLMHLGITNLPMSNYLHIWIVADILDSSGGYSGVKGYSTRPGSYFNGSEGIVIRYDWMGDYSIYGSPLDINTRGNALTHEIGHYLGLWHPFDFGCKGLTANDCDSLGDMCCDVPAVSGQVQSCSYNNSCTETYNSNPPDQKQNYMDYSLPSCKNTFTADQTEIMHTTLLYYRSSLWQPKYINRMTNSLCLLSANTVATRNFMCTGSTDNDSIFAYNQSGATYKWKAYRKFNGSLVSYKTQTGGYFFTLSNSDTGNYTVVLTISNSTDTIKDSITNSLRVEDCGTKIASNRGNWEFGTLAGLGFYANGKAYRDLGPYNEFIASGLNIATEESSLSISDSLGNLAFYGATNFGNPGAFRIYGSNYKPIVGGLIDGFGDGLQQAVAFPAPTGANQYIIVNSIGQKRYDNLNTYTVSSGYLYSIIKINPSNHSLDSVSTRNSISIRDSLGRHIDGGEAVTAIRHCNNKDFWVLCKGQQDTIYRLLATTNNVILYKGFFKCGEFYSQCQINPSPNGKLISIGRKVYTFNRNTGAVKLHFLDTMLFSYGETWGAAFSNNSRVLYRSAPAGKVNGIPKQVVYQYDLESSDILKSRKYFADNFGYRNLQNGPDGKLYINAEGTPFISVINDPDKIIGISKQNACDYQFVGPILSDGGYGGICGLDLPNFANTSYVSNILPDFTATVKNCTTVELLSNQSCSQSHIWFFGDGDSSHSEEPIHTYSAQGKYWIKLVIGNDSIKRQINFTLPKADFGIIGDTIICDTNQLYTYRANEGTDMEYSWSCTNCKNSSPYLNTYETRMRGVGQIKLRIKDNKTGCSLRDSVNIHISNNISNNTISNDTLVCGTAFYTISGSTPTGGNGTFGYKWHKSIDGITWSEVIDSSRKILATKQSDTFIYYREVISNGCKNNSNFTQKAKKYFSKNTISLLNVPCKNGDTVRFSGFYTQANVIGYYYEWQYSYNNISWTGFPSSGTGFSNSDSVWLNRDTFRIDSSTYIRRMLQYGSCISYSNVVLVKPKVSIRVQPKNGYICILGGGGSNTLVTLNIKMNNPLNLTNSFAWYFLQTGTGTWASLGSVSGNSFGDSISNVTNSFTTGMSTGYVLIKCVITTACGKTITSNTAKLYINDTSVNFLTKPKNTYKRDGQVGLFNSNGNGYLQWQRSNNFRRTWFNVTGINDTLLKSDTVRKCFNGTRPMFRMSLNTGCKIVYSPHAFAYHKATQVRMRDIAADDGTEPDPFIANTSFTHSPDIWTTTDPNDTVQPAHFYLGQNLPKADTTNYVWYKVYNRGDTTSDVQTLKIYWTMASTGEAWPNTWTNVTSNQFYNNKKSQSYTKGSLIGTVTIPAIAAGGTYKNKITWLKADIPKPENYYSIVTKRDPITSRIKRDTLAFSEVVLCFLGRVINCGANDGMSFPEVKSLDSNVRNNNKVVTTNTRLVYIHSPFAPWYSVTGVVSELPKTPTIIRHWKDSGTTMGIGCVPVDQGFHNVARAYVVIDDWLYDAWVTGGSLGSGYTVLAPNVFLINPNDTFRLNNIPFNSGDEGHIFTVFERKQGAVIDPMAQFQFDLWQHDEKDSLPEGYVQIFASPEVVAACYDTANSEVTIVNVADATKDSTIYYCRYSNSTFADFSVGYVPHHIETLGVDSFMTINSGGTYSLDSGHYIVTIYDTLNCLVSRINLTVEESAIDTVNGSASFEYSCADSTYLLYSLPCIGAVIKDKDGNVMELDGSDYYLDPKLGPFTQYCIDADNCKVNKTQLTFRFIPDVDPETDDYAFGTYDRSSEDPCCFVSLNHLTCSGTELSEGDTIEIFTMGMDLSASYLLTTTVQYYGESHILGFEFCPPYWNTDEGEINNWYRIVMKSDTCDLCRFDFMCDSAIELSLIAPDTKPDNSAKSNLNKNLKSDTNVKGVSSGISAVTNAEGIITTVSVFPNPASQDVNIRIVNIPANSVKINIYDIAGKLVYTNDFNANKNVSVKINMSDFDDGVYTISIPALNYNYKLILIK